MNIIKKGFKREYIKPSIVMFAMSNEEYLLAASPNVRPGGGGNPPGSITVEPLFLLMEAMTIILKDNVET